MRVLFVGAHLHKGGGQALQTLQLFRALRSKVEAEYLVLRGSGAHSELLEEPGVRSVGTFRYPEGIADLRRAIRASSRQYDLLHVNDLYFGLPAAYLARAYPRIVLFGTDPIWEIGGRYGPGAGALVRAALPVLLRGTTLVTNSGPLGDRFRRFSPTVIPNGLELKRFDALPGHEAARRELGWDASSPVVLYVGEVIPAKRVEWLMQGLQQARSARLVIVGGYREEHYGGSYHRSLLHDYPDVAGRTTFEGEVPSSRVDLYLAAADVFAFPSSFEGMPNAVREAMAAGLPIVASDIPAHRWLLSEGRTGFLVRSAREMGQTIERLLADRDLGARLGVAAREFVREHLAMDAIRDRYLALYRTILGE